jgi:hypothetical protein
MNVHMERCELTNGNLCAAICCCEKVCLLGWRWRLHVSPKRQLTHWTTWHIPEDGTLHSHRCEALTPYVMSTSIVTVRKSLRWLVEEIRTRASSEPVLFIYLFIYLFIVGPGYLLCSNGLRAERPGFDCRQGQDCSFLQTVSGPHPASCEMGAEDCFPGGKSAGLWSWPLTSILCRGQE